MKKRLLKKIFMFSALIIAAGIFPSANYGQHQQPKKSLNSQTARLVKECFDAVRNEDASLIPKVEALGKNVIPYLEPYLFDENDLVWREVLNFLVRFYTKEGSILLAKMLADEESFYGTTKTIYEVLKPSDIAKSPEIYAALLKNFSENRYSLTGILLLKNFPGAETEEALEKVKRDYGDKTEVLPLWVLTVRISLAANFALCRINNSTGCDDLKNQLKTISTHEAFFLMQNLDEIKKPEVLRELQNNLLADTRVYRSTFSEAIYKNSDGGSRFVRPESRVCDLAVNFLTARFKVKVSFKTGKNPYSQSEIDELKKKLNALASK